MGERGFLEGDDLAPYRVPDSGLCWWCGSVATTREHKFKRSDLKRLQGNNGEYLMWGTDDELRSIRSLRKSSLVRFKVNLCGSCNNARSQPFDTSYDRFVDYLWTHMDKLWRFRYVDMQSIYGASWRDETLNLARYLVKHIACRMDHDGFTVPNNFAPFLNGDSLLPNVQMALFKNRALWRLHKKIRKDEDWSLPLGIDPAHGYVSRRRQVLTMYSSSLTFGYIGVFYRWDLDTPHTDPFYIYQKARLHRRDKLPLV